MGEDEVGCSLGPAVAVPGTETPGDAEPAFGFVVAAPEDGGMADVEVVAGDLEPGARLGGIGGDPVGADPACRLTEHQQRQYLESVQVPRFRCVERSDGLGLPEPGELRARRLS